MSLLIAFYAFGLIVLLILVPTVWRVIATDYAKRMERLLQSARLVDAPAGIASLPWWTKSGEVRFPGSLLMVVLHDSMGVWREGVPVSQTRYLRFLFPGRLVAKLASREDDAAAVLKLKCLALQVLVAFEVLVIINGAFFLLIAFLNLGSEMAGR